MKLSFMHFLSVPSPFLSTLLDSLNVLSPNLILLPLAIYILVSSAKPSIACYSTVLVFCVESDQHVEIIVVRVINVGQKIHLFNYTFIM